MKIKALRSFAGRISMSNGDVMECNDPVVLSDLIRAHYVEQVLPGDEPKKPSKKEGGDAGCR